MEVGKSHGKQRILLRFAAEAGFEPASRTPELPDIELNPPSFFYHVLINCFQ